MTPSSLEQLSFLKGSETIYIEKQNEDNLIELKIESTFFVVSSHMFMSSG